MQAAPSSADALCERMRRTLEPQRETISALLQVLSFRKFRFLVFTVPIWLLTFSAIVFINNARAPLLFKLGALCMTLRYLRKALCALRLPAPPATEDPPRFGFDQLIALAESAVAAAYQRAARAVTAVRSNEATLLARVKLALVGAMGLAVLYAVPLVALVSLLTVGLLALPPLIEHGSLEWAARVAQRLGVAAVLRRLRRPSASPAPAPAQ
eukprot:gnl/Chilomastix_cuspidata/2814.p2 GENE.gnl/Chilomastix_cuspidata/2814~~gnl/Chilomastix_cuspidata/2814.p2  ORF type:complete len:212 (-),score=99.28 gnl/Chilomastix_cuspidata/2814:16-651(-)